MVTGSCAVLAIDQKIINVMLKLTDGSLPSHFSSVGTPAWTEAGKVVNAMAVVDATKEAPMRRSCEKCMLAVFTDSIWFVMIE